jgi:hypothetical protein
MTLQDEGFRLVHQDGRFAWTHPAEIQDGAVDCTDMSDEEYEETVARWDAKVAAEEAATASLWDDP